MLHNLFEHNIVYFGLLRGVCNQHKHGVNPSVLLLAHLFDLVCLQNEVGVHLQAVHNVGRGCPLDCLRQLPLR